VDYRRNHPRRRRLPLTDNERTSEHRSVTRVPRCRMENRNENSQSYIQMAKNASAPPPNTRSPTGVQHGDLQLRRRMESHLQSIQISRKRHVTNTTRQNFIKIESAERAEAQERRDLRRPLNERWPKRARCLGRHGRRISGAAAVKKSSARCRLRPAAPRHWLPTREGWQRT
jgi:hypothetical protein